MKVFAVTLLLVSVTMAAPSIMDNKIESDNSLKRIARTMGSCADSEDLMTCLAIKGITAINRASRSNNIEITQGITLARDPSTSITARNGKSITENDIVASLPKDTSDRVSRLIELGIESAMDFLKTHSLQFKLPTETTKNMARAIEEGRGKIKKLMGPLMMALGAKLLALIPILLGGLAILALKALIISKIAFILAAGMGMTKLFGGGSSNLLGKFGGGVAPVAPAAQYGVPSSGWSTGGNQGWSSASSAQYPYARSLDAQDLAFNGQKPNETN